MSSLLRAFALLSLIAFGLTLPTSKASHGQSLMSRQDSPIGLGKMDTKTYHWQPGTGEIDMSAEDARVKLEHMRIKHDPADWIMIDVYGASREGTYLALVLGRGIADDIQIFAATQALIDNHGAVTAATRDLLGLGLFPITAEDAAELVRDLPKPRGRKASGASS